MWSSIGSPEKMRFAGFGGDNVGAHEVITDNPERTLIRLPTAPQGSAGEAVIMEDLKESCGEQVQVGRDLGL